MNGTESFFSKCVTEMQLGFYFSLGTKEQPASLGDDLRDFEMERNFVRKFFSGALNALKALPEWTTTEQIPGEILQLQPYSLCEADSEVEMKQGLACISLWIAAEGTIPIETAKAFEACLHATAVEVAAANGYPTPTPVQTLYYEVLRATRTVPVTLANGYPR